MKISYSLLALTASMSTCGVLGNVPLCEDQLECFDVTIEKIETCTSDCLVKVCLKLDFEKDNCGKNTDEVISHYCINDALGTGNCDPMPLKPTDSSEWLSPGPLPAPVTAEICQEGNPGDTVYFILKDAAVALTDTDVNMYMAPTTGCAGQLTCQNAGTSQCGGGNNDETERLWSYTIPANACDAECLGPIDITGCTSATECSLTGDQDSACATPTCTSNTCGVDLVTDGDPPLDGEDCGSTTDLCSNGFVCEGGACVEKFKSIDDDCGADTGNQCTENKCAMTAVTGITTCTETDVTGPCTGSPSNSCSDGFECVGGSCEEKYLGADDDCDYDGDTTGQIDACTSYKCSGGGDTTNVFIPSMCQPNFENEDTTITATEQAQCGARTDPCSTGFVCDGSGGCKETFSNVGISCTPDSGAADTDCMKYKCLDDDNDGKTTCTAEPVLLETTCDDGGDDPDEECFADFRCDGNGECLATYDSDGSSCDPDDSSNFDESCTNYFCRGSMGIFDVRECTAEFLMASETPSSCSDRTRTDPCSTGYECNGSGQCAETFEDVDTSCEPTSGESDTDCTKYKCLDDDGDGKTACAADFVAEFMSCTDGTADTNEECYNDLQCDGDGACLPTYDANGDTCDPSDSTKGDLDDDCTEYKCVGPTDDGIFSATECSPIFENKNENSCISNEDSDAGEDFSGAMSRGDCHDGDKCDEGYCEPTRKDETSVCNAQAGCCDVAETCPDPSGLDEDDPYDCPSDEVASADTVCRAACDGCEADVPELCDGVSKTCKENVVFEDMLCILAGQFSLVGTVSVQIIEDNGDFYLQGSISLTEELSSGSESVKIYLYTDEPQSAAAGQFNIKGTDLQFGGYLSQDFGVNLDPSACTGDKMDDFFLAVHLDMQDGNTAWAKNCGDEAVPSGTLAETKNFVSSNEFCRVNARGRRNCSNNWGQHHSYQLCCNDVRDDCDGCTSAPTDAGRMFSTAAATTTAGVGSSTGSSTGSSSSRSSACDDLFTLDSLLSFGWFRCLWEWIMRIFDRIWPF